ncbi:MAG: SDR family oxidoreductase [Chthoniobacterales bacterium]
MGCPTAYLSAYAATKGAVVGLIRSLAHELKGTNITVNCVIPGAIEVEKENLELGANQKLIEWQTVPRRLTAADILAPDCFFLSNAAGGITAQTLTVDGGLIYPIADGQLQGHLLDKKR